MLYHHSNENVKSYKPPVNQQPQLHSQINLPTASDKNALFICDAKVTLTDALLASSELTTINKDRH